MFLCFGVVSVEGWLGGMKGGGMGTHKNERLRLITHAHTGGGGLAAAATTVG